MRLIKLNFTVIILLLLSSCCSKIIKQETETIKILKEIRNDSIIINNSPKIIYTGDSIIQTRPFLIRIDTILKTIYQNRVKIDTIKINYSYPDNKFNLSVKSLPDSIFNEIRTEIKTLQEKSFIDRFFDSYIWYLAGLILIILISYIIIIKK